MQKYLNLSKGSASDVVMKFLEKSHPLQFTTEELAGNLKIKPRDVWNAARRLRDAGVITTEAKIGHQFVIWHGVIIGPAPRKKIPLVSRMPNKRERKIAEVAAGFARDNEKNAEFKKSNQSGYTVTSADRAKIRVIPTPPNLGNRAYVAPDEVPMMFSALRPGQYLEAA